MEWQIVGSITLLVCDVCGTKQEEGKHDIYEWKIIIAPGDPYYPYCTPSFEQSLEVCKSCFAELESFERIVQQGLKDLTTRIWNART